MFCLLPCCPLLLPPSLSQRNVLHLTLTSPQLHTHRGEFPPRSGDKAESTLNMGGLHLSLCSFRPLHSFREKRGSKWRRNTSICTETRHTSIVTQRSATDQQTTWTSVFSIIHFFKCIHKNVYFLINLFNYICDNAKCLCAPFSIVIKYTSYTSQT